MIDGTMGRFLIFLATAGVVGCDKGHSSSLDLPQFPVAEHLRSLVQSAPTIIIGRVADIKQGRTAGPPEERLQFRDVRVVVERILKGEIPTDTVLLEQVDPEGRVILGGFKPYRLGERYALLVRAGEGGHYVALPQGRYGLRGGSVHSTQPGPVSDKVDGMDEDAFIAEIEAIVSEKANPPV